MYLRLTKIEHARCDLRIGTLTFNDLGYQIFEISKYILLDVDYAFFFFSAASNHVHDGCRFREVSSLYMHKCSEDNRSDRWCSKAAERICIRSDVHAGAYAFGYMRAKRRNR